MSIVYVGFDVAVHGLDLASESDMEALRKRIKDAVEMQHPKGYSNLFESDVEVEITEHAGTPNVELNGAPR